MNLNLQVTKSLFTILPFTRYAMPRPRTGFFLSVVIRARCCVVSIVHFMSEHCFHRRVE